MFSKTELGCFLEEEYSKEVSERYFFNYSFLECSLLLSDLELLDSVQKRQLLIEVLKGIYGDHAQWQMHERQLPFEAIERVGAIALNIKNQSLMARAYLNGIVGKQLLEDENNEVSAAIHQRQMRIFNNIIPVLPCGHAENLIVCVLGLKGAGKSAVLNSLAKRGNYVIEIYHEIDKLKQCKSPLLEYLPSDPSLWRDEPIRTALVGNGYDSAMPKILYVGSLLRHSEIRYLSTMGRLSFLCISAKNSVRHERARLRGRFIERHASEDRLIELDAHRDGLWPNYETNDVGGLITYSTFTVENGVDTDIDEVVNQIELHVNSSKEKEKT